ncbi:MAG: hypothetical protein QOG26_1159 [Solirubrobacterales bacterium]|jgi:hypothetical protein|nr:hypothetical protein [Solirubrobacterales bacterium]
MSPARRLAMLAALTAALLGATAAPALAADTYADATNGDDAYDCVHDTVTGNPPANPGDPAEGPCKTIQTAIDRAGPSETAHVLAGTYAEKLTLAGGKSLQGEGATAPAIAADSDCTAPVAPALSVGAAESAGSITNLSFTTTCAEAQIGLQIAGAMASTAKIADDSISGFSTAIWLDGAAALPQVQHNSIVGIHPPATPPGDGVGIDVGGGADPKLIENTIGGSGAGSTGISLHSPAPGPMTEVRGNSLSGLDDGIVLDGSLATLDANQLTAISGTGIDISGYASPILTGNSIAIPGATTGIAISEASPPLSGAGTGAKLERNRVSGAATGISVENTTAAVSLFDDVVSGTSVAGLALTDTTAAGNGADATVRNATIAAKSGGNEITIGDAELTLDSSIVGDDGTGGIAAAPGSTSEQCHISFSRGPAVPMSPAADGCDSFDTSATPVFSDSALHLDGDASGDLVDAGNPDPFAEDSGGDVDGDPRLVDGNDDCEIVRDIGADEFAPTGPPGTCPPVLDTTLVKKKGPRIFFYLVGPLGGNYTLCLRGPHLKGQNDRRCRTFRAVKTHGHFVSIVNWGRYFRTQGPGHYQVTWRQPGTTKQLGPSRAFTWASACPPPEQTMDGVWKPHRLQIISRCKTIVERISGSNYYSSNDNDIHLGFSGRIARAEVLDRDANHLRNTSKHDHGNGPHDPHPGDRIRFTGVLVCDTFHGPFGSYEMHPPFKLQFLNGSRRTRISGPQYPGTPRVKLKQQGRFHCH